MALIHIDLQPEDASVHTFTRQAMKSPTDILIKAAYIVEFPPHKRPRQCEAKCLIPRE